MPTVSVKKLNEDGSPSTENDTSLEYSIGENIFEFLQDHDYNLPHGCLNGACSACRVIILEGSEFISPESIREKETLKRFKENYQQKEGSKPLDGLVLRLSCQMKFLVEGNIELAAFT